jgi:hypothetical protein
LKILQQNGHPIALKNHEQDRSTIGDPKMLTRAGKQLRNWQSTNIIQRIEELVDRVFNQHHFIAIPTPPPTLRLVIEEFTELHELQKVAAHLSVIQRFPVQEIPIAA